MVCVNFEELSLSEVIRMDKAIKAMNNVEDEKDEKDVISPAGEVVSPGDVQLSLTGGAGTFTDAIG